MIKISDIGIEKTIQYCNDYCIKNPYHSPQINIVGSDIISEFLEYLEELSEISEVHELGGKSGMRRYPIDKKLNDIIHQAHTSIGCGIKVIKKPIHSLMSYEKWEGGYIEGFARMDSDVQHIEWFHWTYIRMKHLKNIIEKFENNLIIY